MAKDSILKLKVESDEYDAKLKKAAEGIRHLADVAHNGGGELTGLEKAELDYIKALGEMETKSRTASGSVREMESAFKELTVVYNNLNDVEKADEGGKALAASLETLKQRTIDAKAQLDAASKSLQDNSSAGQQESSVLDQLASKFTINIDALKLFDLGLKGVDMALKVAKDAFFQSESNIDDWGRAVQSSEAAYNIFLDTLNTGNWSGFFQNLNTAIDGARELYNALDRLGSIKSNNAAAIAIVQQQIAQLRLAKQQGQDVDSQLKKATETLANLQKQSVTAGKNAGQMMAAETIKNRFNAQGGNLAGSSANAIVERIMKNGQSEFDRQKKILENLTNKGKTTRDYGTYKVQGVFDINNLTKEQQKQYKLAKAITEGETEIQKGIDIYAQAVREGTANAREEFKGNRYALQGSGGSGGSGGGKSPAVSKEEVERERMFAQLRNAEAKASKIIADERAKEHRTETRGTSGFNEQNIANWTSMMKDQLSEADFGSVMYNQIVENMKDMSVITELTKEAVKRGFSPNELGLTELFEQAFDNIDVDDNAIQAIIDKINEIFKDNPIELNVKTGGKDGIKPVSDEVKKLVKTANITADVVGSIGDAFNAIEDPAAKVAGIVAQAIANVALGYAKALTMVEETGGPWGWIAFAATGAATMLTSIAQIHSATGYAEGGIVKGNHYSGDMLDGGSFGINAGELVLNRAQQGSLASQLEGGGLRNIRLSAEVQGEKIVMVANRYFRRTGQGEILTWK